MKKFIKYCLIFLIAIISLYVAAFFIPSFGNHASTYAAVDKEVENWKQGRDWLSSLDIGSKPSDKFIIFENKLYLRIQKDDSSIMAPVRGIDKWNIDTLHAFQKQHPELDKYWPDKNAPNLGVKWVK